MESYAKTTRIIGVVFWDRILTQQAGLTTSSIICYQ